MVAFKVGAAVLATLICVMPRDSSSQALTVLHIKVLLIDAEQKTTPVPRHALLISDNPATSTPRRVMTGGDGTVDVRLRPGNYTIESDQPVVFHGKAFQWTQTLDVVAGRDATLELTAANAEEVEAPAESAAPGATNTRPPLESDPAFLLRDWQDSVVAIWTEDTRASGFAIDAKGLIATNQKVIGTAASVEVQLTPAVKVTGRVLAADSARDVAILWIDPQAAASLRPVPVRCAEGEKPALTNGQELFTIGSPLRGPKDMTSGQVSRADQRPISPDWYHDTGSVGGPVFVVGGAVVGLTSLGEEEDRRGRRDSRVVSLADVCAVVVAAEQKMTGTPPAGTHLPVEPSIAVPEATLKDAVKRRTGNLNPYQVSSADFDLGFITPVMIYGAKDKMQDFSNWSAYVADIPTVLLVRATPRMVESFWTTVGRAAARTQGVALPPIKHFKSGFARLRAFCGDAEVTPIHPFRMEQRVSDTDAIHEGLYVFDPDVLGPHCGTVKFTLYSEKEPEKGDTRDVDPKVLQQIWRDFESYRALKNERAGR